MRQQEATGGIDHQLNDVMALSVRYVHKQIDRAIEDTGSSLPDGNEVYVIANPARASPPWRQKPECRAAESPA